MDSLCQVTQVEQGGRYAEYQIKGAHEVTFTDSTSGIVL